MEKECKHPPLWRENLRRGGIGWRLACFVLLLFVASPAMAQREQTFTVSFKASTLEEVFDYLSKNSDYVFTYNSADLRQSSARVTRDFADAPLRMILDECLRGTEFTFEFVDRHVVITKRSSAPRSVTVCGFVYDENRQPLPGVTVQVVGTSVGTATTEKGWFSLDLPMLKGKLRFSFVGYKDKDVEFFAKMAKDTLKVCMEENVEQLDEAIVVGYGTTTKRETTGSITVIKGEDLKGIPSSNLATLLQGRVAGMDITQMSGSPGGGGTSIVVRGYNSLDVEQGRRFSNPLCVVDGVPLNSFTSPITGTNLLADINPDMIESIQILKDASAASIYGSRAANGVIIVTTKKGNKNQDAVFSVNASYTWSMLPRLPGVTIGRMERWKRLIQARKTYSAYLDRDDLTYKYPTSLKDIYDRQEGSLDANWIPFPSGEFRNGSTLQDSLNPFYNNATNFFPMYYETAHIMNANIQAYEGSERMTYGLGLGYYDEGGVLKGTGFKRVDLSMNMNVIPVKRFNIDMRFNATLVNRKRGTNGGDGLSSAPSIETVPGDPFELSTLMPGAGSSVWEAALENLQGTKEANRNIRLRANFRLGYQIVEGLDVSASLAADYSIARRNYFQPSYLDTENRSQSVGETGINMMILTEEVLNWKKTFNEDHNINLMAGFSYQYDQMEYNGGYAKNSPSDKIYYAPAGLPDFDIEDEYGTQNYVPLKFYQSDMQEKALMSYFARLEYNFRQKYLFSVAFRRDGSSTFGAANRWGDLPFHCGRMVVLRGAFRQGQCGVVVVRQDSRQLGAFRYAFRLSLLGFGCRGERPELSRARYINPDF